MTTFDFSPRNGLVFSKSFATANLSATRMSPSFGVPSFTVAAITESSISGLGAQAWTMDGATSLAKAAAKGAFNPGTGSWAIAGAFKTNNAGTGGYVVAASRGGGASHDIGYQLAMSGGGHAAGKLRMYVSDGTTVLDEATSATYNADTVVRYFWHGDKTAGTVKLYAGVNGAAIALVHTMSGFGALGTLSNSDYFGLGYNSDSASNFWLGSLGLYFRAWRNPSTEFTLAAVQEYDNSAAGLTDAQILDNRLPGSRHYKP